MFALSTGATTNPTLSVDGKYLCYKSDFIQHYLVKNIKNL